MEQDAIRESLAQQLNEALEALRNLTRIAEVSFQTEYGNMLSYERAALKTARAILAKHKEPK